MAGTDNNNAGTVQTKSMRFRVIRLCFPLFVWLILSPGPASSQTRRIELLRTNDGVLLDLPRNTAWKRRASVVAERRARLYRSGDWATLNSVAAAPGYTTDAMLSGTLHVPTVLFAYSDTRLENLPAASVYDSILFAAELPTGRPYTLRTYYEEVSNGVFSLRGKAFGWFLADSSRSYFATGCSDIEGRIGCAAGRLRLSEAMTDALIQADSSTDFSAFDNDGADGVPNSGDDDGVVDVVQFVQSELGAECGGDGYWAHRYSLSGLAGSAFLTDDVGAGGDQIGIDPYVLVSGVGGSDCQHSSEPMPIGIAAHELGHSIGLPDLYDTDEYDEDYSEGIGEWGLMGTGGYASLFSPGQLSAWSKERLGWVVVRGLESNDKYTIGPVVTADTVFRIDPPGNNPRGEYFLLENRQSVGSDTANIAGGTYHLGKLGGLLIWHIDSARVSDAELYNRINTGPVHGVRLVQADDTSYSLIANRGDAGDPFPGFWLKRRFSRITQPAPQLNHEALFPGFILDSIRQVVVNGEIAFTLAKGSVTTVTASDDRASVTVDGTHYHRFEDIFVDGSVHTVGMDSLQSMEGTYYAFESWSNGGARNHEVIGSADGDSLVADVSLRYSVYGEPTSHDGHGTVVLYDAHGNAFERPATTLVMAGDEVTLIAIPDEGSCFGSWHEPFETIGDTLRLVVERPYYIRGVFTSCITIVTDELPLGYAGTFYSSLISMTGGWGDRVWEMEGAARGLSLGPGGEWGREGELSGVPQDTGEFDITVTVHRGINSASKDFQLRITEPPSVNTGDIVDRLVGMEDNMSEQVADFLDFTGNKNGQLDVGDFYLYYKREANSKAESAATPTPRDARKAMNPSSQRRFQ